MLWSHWLHPTSSMLSKAKPDWMPSEEESTQSMPGCDRFLEKATMVLMLRRETM